MGLQLSGMPDFGDFVESIRDNMSLLATGSEAEALDTLDEMYKRKTSGKGIHMVTAAYEEWDRGRLEIWVNDALTTRDVSDPELSINGRRYYTLDLHPSDVLTVCIATKRVAIIVQRRIRGNDTNSDFDYLLVRGVMEQFPKSKFVILYEPNRRIQGYRHIPDEHILHLKSKLPSENIFEHELLPLDSAERAGTKELMIATKNEPESKHCITVEVQYDEKEVVIGLGDGNHATYSTSPKET